MHCRSFDILPLFCPRLAQNDQTFSNPHCTGRVFSPPHPLTAHDDATPELEITPLLRTFLFPLSERRIGYFFDLGSQSKT